MTFKLFTLDKVLDKKDPLNLDLILYKINTSLQGDSFIINYKSLYENRKKYTKLELIHYITLASFRSVEEYRICENIALPIELGFTSIAAIENNKLLDIDYESRKVLFRFEEEELRKRKNGTKIFRR